MGDMIALEDPPAKSVEGLFANVAFATIDSDDFSTDACKELRDSLQAQGAIYYGRDENGKIPIERITHIIASTSDFPEYFSASESLVSTVKPEWVAASEAKRRLAPTRQFSPDPRLFFGGITVCCADLPEGDEEAIIGGVLAMGGQYSASLTKTVTHIVALAEDNDKCKAALAKNMRCKIVLPHWFDDCLRLGKKIDEGPYTLPNPEITRKCSSEPVLTPSSLHLAGASSPQPKRLQNSTDIVQRDIDVFSGKNILLGQDLDLGLRLKAIIVVIIRQGGGALVENVKTADMLVCRYRSGGEYQTASRLGKDVGNLSWLYFLITHNRWTSPMRRLLHYPVSRDPLPGFENYRIALSNYAGEARLYLESLVLAAGGQFTKNMRQDNTHLITAHTHSEKCEAAQEWSINIVNHLWLEDSYAKWRVQALTNPKYIHFPARTNLGEVVGQTQIDPRATEDKFFPPIEEVESQKQDQASSVDQQLLSEHAMAPPRSSEGRYFREESTSTPINSKAAPRKRSKQTPDTPVSSKMVIDGKENETPLSTGRGAKNRAVAKLHDLAPDIALYEKEKRRSGGVVRGGRRTIEESTPSRKRSASFDQEDVEMQDEGAKKIRKRGPPTMKLLVTGYDRWIGQEVKEDVERKHLRDMGILVTQDPKRCTHMVAPNVVRTQKFICAIAHAPIVMHTRFIDHCLEEDELPDDLGKFILKDGAGEKKYKVRLSDSLARAKTNRGRLFRGMNVFCTQEVHGGFETYSAIISHNGGTCQLFRARPGSVSSIEEARTQSQTPQDADSSDESEDEHEVEDTVFLLSGERPEERRLWTKFRHMASEKGRSALIVRTDWIIESAMRQEVLEARGYEMKER